MPLRVVLYAEGGGETRGTMTLPLPPESVSARTGSARATF